MKPACIVKGHRAGLFSMTNKVMACLRLYERVYVDFSEGCIYGEEGTNIWTDLFAWNDIAEEGADIISEYPEHSLTGPAAGALYLSGNAWRDECHALWKRMRCRLPEIETPDSMDTVSCLVRCTSHFAEQPGNKQQTLDDYAAAFERVRRPNTILHVVCRDKESLRWLGERFPIGYCTHTERTERRDDPEIHLARRQTLAEAIECLSEVLVMSASRALIHPVSNMATAALYMNPAMESVYLH